MGKSSPLRTVTNVDINGVIEMQKAGNVAAQPSSGLVSQNLPSSSDSFTENISLTDDDSCSDRDKTSAKPQFAGNNQLVTNVASTSGQRNLDVNPENTEP